jgi:hypothetical protein
VRLLNTEPRDTARFRRQGDEKELAKEPELRDWRWRWNPKENRSLETK